MNGRRERQPSDKMKFEVCNSVFPLGSPYGNGFGPMFNHQVDKLAPCCWVQKDLGILTAAVIVTMIAIITSVSHRHTGGRVWMHCKHELKIMR